MSVTIPTWAQNPSETSSKRINLAYVSYPPYYASDLPHGGPISQIIEEAFERAGYSVSREELPWARAFEWTREGEYDALYTAWYREERKEHFAFSEPLPANEIVFFAHRDLARDYNGPESLNNKVLGVVRGYALPAKLSLASLSVQRVTSDQQNIEKLVRGYIDVTIIDRALAKYLMRQFAPSKIDLYQALNPPLEIENQHLIFSRKAENYAAKLASFNAAYLQLKAEGRVSQLLKEHGLDE
ncbi:MAG: transporter substrate-binding domain-containing protein [Oleiphilaceae bacterium]|nr:transporter substrate-binding domain-containing protein [Oleiphilaceae bacterium]